MEENKYTYVGGSYSYTIDTGKPSGRAASAAADTDAGSGLAGSASGAGMPGGSNLQPPKKKLRSKKPLIIFGSILVGIILLAILWNTMGWGSSEEELSGAADVTEDHIGVLYIEGTISESDTTYNHGYVLDAIDGMMENDNNLGLMLYVNTPGGGVYESDEVHLKIKEYQETTGRPVYAYLGSQATSGGYYVSASADRIVANRNCWTGSIGVTIGNLYDISGLLAKYGVTVNTITSGDNKAMGDMTAPMTEEQRAILQSLVDDAYDQFVSVVAEGRELSETYVRSISDGRIYTAKQAHSVNLVDGIVNTYDDAVNDMKAAFELGDCEVYEFRYVMEYEFLSSFLQTMEKLAEASSADGDLDALTRLMESSNEWTLQYMCEVTR